MNQPNGTPTLYALLIGVGAYERVRPLRGPVGDARAVADYLTQFAPDFTPDVRLLTDQQATKEAIIAGFETHLMQAGPGDVALFYFAGHGTQEAADPTLWSTETDGRLECLVCHDADTTRYADFLLADKELRYLLAPLSATGAHVVTLFDCCHSGDNTRSDALLEAALTDQDVRERRLGGAAPQRPYDAFCFHDALPAETIRLLGIDAALPQGAYVQLSACESDESAMEVNGEGVFTKHLLAVLRSAHGRVSYGDLHSRVRQALRFGFEQHPRLYSPDDSLDNDLPGEASPGNATTGRTTGFLNRPPDADAYPATVTYNKQEGWLLDLGAIHGLGSGSRTVQLYDAAGEPHPVSTQRVGADYAVLDLPDALRIRLDKTTAYRATIANVARTPITLALVSHGGVDEDRPDLLNALTTRAGACFTLADDTAPADFWLHLRHGLFYVTRPDDDNRPLIRPIRADDPQALESLVRAVRHLARWRYLTDLRNEAALQPVLDISVGTNDSAPTPLPDAHPEPLDVTFVPLGSAYSASLTVQLHNPQDQALYCTVLYLSRDFGSFAGFLPTNFRLEAGQTVRLGLADKRQLTGRQQTLRLRLEDVIREYNWPVATEHIKVLITTEPLSEPTLAYLQLDTLPSPPVLADRGQSDGRGGFATDADTLEPLPDWSTQTLTLNLTNPLYNRVRADELARMLRADSPDDVQADFALGLYYTATTAGNTEPELILRPELTVLTDDGERGLWNDLKTGVANQLIQQRRNRQYVQNLVRYPDRIRIVAAGDSWFQYPVGLRDIVDQLAGVFTVYSVAGTSVGDYLTDSRLLETLAQVKPQFCLLSAGGTDLFGDALPTLLRDAPDPQQTGPQRYVTANFSTLLARLSDQFGRLLRLMQQGYPQVRVVVHGYDYGPPELAGDVTGSLQTGSIRTGFVQTGSVQTGFVDDTLRQKGIIDPADRRAVVRYLLDEFNRMLQTLPATYPNLTCLDLRGMLPTADYWYDERHPNNRGFLRLTTRFAEQIQPPKLTAELPEPTTAPARWSTAFLEQKRTVGDPPADAVIETLLDQHQKGEIDQIFQMLVRNRQFPNPAFDVLPDPVKAVVEDYFLVTRHLPAFADSFRLRVAADVFRQHGPKILFLLLCRSLPLCYTCWRGAKVLYRTGRLRVHDGSLDAFSRRLMETAQFVTDVLTPDNFEPDGTAIIAVQKVRLMHATIRYFARQRTWDTTTYGVPINQEDLAGTLLSFSVVITDGLEQLGVRLSPDERAAFMHLWRVVGAMIGLTDDLLTDDEAEARALMDAILAHQAGPSTEGAELTDACLDLMNSRMLVGPLQRLSPYFVRYLIGDTYADMLRVPVVPADDSFVLTLAQQLDGRIRQFDGHNVLLAALGRTVSHGMIRQMLTYSNAAKREQFYLPSALTDDWNTVEPGFRVPTLHTIGEVITYLDRLARHFRAQNNPMGLFCAIYKLVTQRVAEGLRLGRFVNPVEMELVDVGFGNRYFEALNAYFDGRPASGPWQLSFENARTPMVADQHIFAAANAHISFDLPIVVAEVYRGRDMTPFLPDFAQMNALFDGMYDQMNDNVGRIFRPFGAVVRHFSGPLKDLEHAVMKQGRELAWTKSRQLHGATDAADYARLLAQLEADSAAMGRRITLPPGPLRLPLQLLARQEFGTAAHKIDVMLRTALLPAVT